MCPVQEEPLPCRLGLNGLRCRVRLGWEAPERVQAQWVSFDIALKLRALPEGCFTDRLEGTIGYDSLSEWVREVCAEGEYRLIERLGYQVYRRLRERVPDAVAVRVAVTKEQPPIQDLERGATFTLGDWEGP